MSACELFSHLPRKVGFAQMVDQHRIPALVFDLRPHPIALGLGLGEVGGGAIDFDRCIATPDMMPLVGRLGKVLGPRGLMPSPKIGAVTMDVTGAVKGAKGGSVEFRVESAGILQAGVGKASFSEEKLVQNIKAFADAVNKAKPAGAKGHYINRVSISSTMGPGVKVDMATLAAVAAEK